MNARNFANVRVRTNKKKKQQINTSPQKLERGAETNR